MIAVYIVTKNMTLEQHTKVGLPRFDGQVDYAASVGVWWICCSYSTGVR